MEDAAELPFPPISSAAQPGEDFPPEPVGRCLRADGTALGWPKSSCRCGQRLRTAGHACSCPAGAVPGDAVGVPGAAGAASTQVCMSRGLTATVPRRRGEGTGWGCDAEGVCKAIPSVLVCPGHHQAFGSGACVCGVWAGAAAVGRRQEVAGQRHSKSQSTAPEDSGSEHFSKQVMLKGCAEPSAQAGSPGSPGLLAPWVRAILPRCQAFQEQDLLQHFPPGNRAEMAEVTRQEG